MPVHDQLILRPVELCPVPDVVVVFVDVIVVVVDVDVVVDVVLVASVVFSGPEDSSRF